MLLMYHWKPKLKKDICIYTIYSSSNKRKYSDVNLIKYVQILYVENHEALMKEMLKTPNCREIYCVHGLSETS